MKKYTKDIGFALIIRKKPIDSYLVDVFKNAYSINKRFFKKTPKKFKIIICDNEEEFKKEAKYEYRKYITGTVLRNNNLVMRSLGFVLKIGRWDKNGYKNLVNHEVNHAFWCSLYKTWNPIWLVEGLANYIGTNFILKRKELAKVIKEYKVNSSILNYRPLVRYFKEGHYPRYPVWSNFTDYIAKRYSANKLIKLMNEFSKNPTKKNYIIIFKKIFGKSDKEMFNDFIKFLRC